MWPMEQFEFETPALKFRTNLFSENNGPGFVMSPQLDYIFSYASGGEPFHYHGPHELYIITGGQQNQLIVLPLPMRKSDYS